MKYPRHYNLNKKCTDCTKRVSNYAIRCKKCSNRLNASGKKWSDEHIVKIANYWKGRRKEFENRKASYVAVHLWLKKYHKKEGKCVHCGSKEKSRYEWALIKGRRYEKKRDNFVELCVRCHRIYDGTMAWQNRAKLQSRTASDLMRTSL